MSSRTPDDELQTPGPEKKPSGLRMRDKRSYKPLMLVKMDTAESVCFQEIVIVKNAGKQICFEAPNPVALFLSSAEKSLKRSRALHCSLQTWECDNYIESMVSVGKLRDAYDYLEEIQGCVVAVHTAVEALANLAIPKNFKMTRTNSKGVAETWTKENIERWMTLTDKLTNVLPGILDVANPNVLPCWAAFKKLESLRNEIIHPKCVRLQPDRMHFGFVNRLLHAEVFTFVESGFELIKYFVVNDETNPKFPIGFGATKAGVVKVDNWEDHMIEHIGPNLDPSE